jgi:hypothetical protein
VVTVLVCLLQSAASAQVIETREGDSNPGKVLFLSTLYGAGTGLVLGGAYALVDDDDDPGTGDILQWGVAAGAATGLVVGLIYCATRSEPQGTAEEVGLLRMNGSDVGVSVPTVRASPAARSVGLTLMTVGF